MIGHSEGRIHMEEQHGQTRPMSLRGARSPGAPVVHFRFIAKGRRGIGHTMLRPLQSMSPAQCSGISAVCLSGDDCRL